MKKLTHFKNTVKETKGYITVGIGLFLLNSPTFTNADVLENVKTSVNTLSKNIVLAGAGVAIAVMAAMLVIKGLMVLLKEDGIRELKAFVPKILIAGVCIFGASMLATVIKSLVEGAGFKNTF